MDFNKVKTQINKITRTVEMIESDGQITKLEVDLLKDYIKKLYELTIIDSDIISSTSSNKTSVAAAEVVKPQNGNAHREDKVKVDKPIASPPPVEETVAKVEKAPEKPVSQPEVAIEEKPSVPDDILSLFQLEDDATELSEKLSKTAIQDIEKAMSINEKIFTINELFNGNSQEFRSCLSHLESLHSYQEAVDHLSHGPAQKYDWGEEEKRKKAQIFIQLVNRKFS